MPYTISLRSMPQDSRVILVGCGGTGGFVADGLCRLLIKHPHLEILLVDHDRVEPHNLLRQLFFPGDVGKFKSQALAERLSRQYGRPIAYSVYPYMHDLIGNNIGAGMHTRAVQGLIISCVDNADARRNIAETLQYGNWWLDAGNGYSSGQVLIGNTIRIEYLRKGFREGTKEAASLPAPTLQLPSLLAPPAKKKEKKMDCAEAVAADEQSPVINQVMASLVLEFVHQLFNDSLQWMGAYLDLAAGTLQTVPAEPVTVARMLGVKVDTLVLKSKEEKEER